MVGNQNFSWVDSRPTRGSPSSLNSSPKPYKSDTLYLRPRVCFGSQAKSAFGTKILGAAQSWGKSVKSTKSSKIMMGFARFEPKAVPKYENARKIKHVFLK